MVTLSDETITICQCVQRMLISAENQQLSAESEKPLLKKAKAFAKQVSLDEFEKYLELNRNSADLLARFLINQQAKQREESQDESPAKSSNSANDEEGEKFKSQFYGLNEGEILDQSPAFDVSDEETMITELSDKPVAGEATFVNMPVMVSANDVVRGRGTALLLFNQTANLWHILCRSYDALLANFVLTSNSELSADDATISFHVQDFTSGKPCLTKISLTFENSMSLETFYGFIDDEE